MSQAVRAEMVTLLYQHTPSAIVGTSVAVLVIWIVFAGKIPTQTLILWSAAMTGVLLWRYTSYVRFRRTPARERQIHVWEGLATLSAGITGLCLGVGGAVIASPVSPFYQGAILLLILGVVVSAIPFLGAIRKAYLADSVGAIVPIVVWCIQYWQPIYVSTAVMMGVFIWAAWTTSTKYSYSIESVIRTKFELGKVTVAKKALQKSFEKLASVEQEVRGSEERFRGIFEGGLVGMAILSKDGTIQRVNHAFCRLLGYENDELIGRQYGELVHPNCVDSMNDYFNSAAESELTGRQRETQYRHKDGHDIFGLAALTTIRGDTGDILGIVVQAQDVTLERGIRKQLVFQASHDDLTGLVNRREFQNRLERIANSATKRGSQHVLCYVDLDHFKMVNDTAGDAMLRQIVQIMRGLFRSRDTLARLGGDEFGIILEHCDVVDAASLCTAFVYKLGNTDFEWNDHTFRIRASVGLVTITDKSPPTGELMRQADLACYTAKDSGGGQVYAFASQEDDPAQCSDIIRAVQCMDALYDDRLRLFAQPIVPLQDSNQDTPWYEILLRVVANEGAVVSPRLLIPAAERYGQMASIDRWVIDKTLKEYRTLSRDSEIRFSINLSGTSISGGDLPDYIIGKFDEYGVPAERICFELTETAAVKNVNQVLDLMSRLKGLGCHFSLDDFGSGLSSFKYLKQFPFDFLKIDGSLIHDITDDSTDLAMVKAIEQLSASLGLKCVAEWISSSEVVQIVTSLGVDYGQGFFCGKPIPIENIALRTQRKPLRLVVSAG